MSAWKKCIVVLAIAVCMAAGCESGNSESGGENSAVPQHPGHSDPEPNMPENDGGSGAY